VFGEKRDACRILVKKTLSQFERPRRRWKEIIWEINRMVSNGLDLSDSG
jgi:hypothetical protein